MKNKNKRTRMIVYTILTLLAVVWVLPIIWIVLTSFRSEGGMFVDYFIPHHFTLDNYKMLFTNSTYPFGRWFMNTLIVAVVSATLSTFITVVMGIFVIKIKVPLAWPFLTRCVGIEHVSWLYEYDCYLLHFEGNWIDTITSCTNFGLCSRSSVRILCTKRFF